MAANEHAPSHRTSDRLAAGLRGCSAGRPKFWGLVLLVVVLLVAGALAYLRTESGLAQLARLIERLASSEQSTLTIGASRRGFSGAPAARERLAHR